MKRILIANRGEIAVRIAQTCHDMGIESIALYSDKDRQALHVARATQAYHLQGVTLADTYLNISQIIEVALKAGADAIHPGYGLLSENAEFAEAVVAAGIVWIGPSAPVIETLGDKMLAREVAIRAGAPVVAGTKEALRSSEEVRDFAQQYGLPVAVKAAHGGGGRGMRVIWREDEIDHAFHSAAQEAELAFGRSECYVEKYLARPRHIEVQILADEYGTVIALDTRDCSMQRRFQKLVEEAPAPFLSESIRSKAVNAARSIAHVSGYVGAATVEFLLSADGELSFLEVNTRLQVEHSVTEEAVGIDIVREQIEIARGRRLRFENDLVAMKHAIEFRITCEDPGRGFMPVPGNVDVFEPALGPGVRTDTSVLSGHVVQPDFDSLVMKVIVSGANRAEALERARRALSEMSLTGLPSVLDFQRRLLEEPDFIADDGLNIHTRWVEEDLTWELPPSTEYSRPAGTNAGLQLIDVTIDGRRVELGLPSSLLGPRAAADPASEQATTASTPEEDVHGTVLAEVTGTVVNVPVRTGQAVSEGDRILVLESMKMECPVPAPVSGTITEILAAEGQLVRAGDVLARITP